MSDDTSDIITPASFQPSSAERSSRFRTSPITIGLLALLVVVLAVIWFLFTARSVRLAFTPPAEDVTIVGGLSFELSGVWLLREGRYQITATAPGHHPIATTIDVTSERNQTFELAFEKLPGLITFRSIPAGADVIVDGETIGVTPLTEFEIRYGRHDVLMELTRYQPHSVGLDVTGMLVTQEVDVALVPDWGTVQLVTEPAGAEVYVDETPTGSVTPYDIEVPSGRHTLRIKKPGYKSHSIKLDVVAEETYPVPPITLEPADGLVFLETTPAGAGVTVDGQYQGTSPIELSLEPAANHRIQLFKAGFETSTRTLRIASGEDRKLAVDLERLTGELVIEVQPARAEVLIDGRTLGRGAQTLTLPTVAHDVEIRLDGYAGYRKRIVPRPGLTQALKVRLLTMAEARLAALKPEIETAQGQTMVLIQPPAQPFVVGASRREPGRRANETLRDVTLTQNYYLSRDEVTNAQFKVFDPQHDSGTFEDLPLNEDDQPVVRIPWHKAAMYCNWLSDQDELTPFYTVEDGKITGSNPASTGYRLPTEAEWSWAAQGESRDRFPWGQQLPPPDRFGNFADRAAAHLVGRIVFGYNDNHIVAAPVGTFTPDRNGLHDVIGNVAEWMTDYYDIPEPGPVTDPMGPPTGEYRVIKGASWMHGTITDLRTSFRDYGIQGRDDVGFRLARFAERI